MARPLPQSCLDAGHTRRVRANGKAFCHECRNASRDTDRAAKRAWAAEVKVAAGCVRCGFAAHPDALQFHHLDPETKDAKVSRMCGRSWARLRAEVAACEVICANCHAILHAVERESVRDV